MEFLPIKTRPMLPPKDDIYDVLDTYLPPMQEGDMLLITSKVLGIHQGRCMPVGDVKDKHDLIRKEAEKYIEPAPNAKYPTMLTIKHHTLIASAGIDESNANGYYILWPERIQETAKELWEYVRKVRGLKNVGIIITDSHCLPLRWGVLGVAIGFWGFQPMTDLRGKEDLFGRKLAMTRQNIPDTIAALGVHLMGESNESTPLLLVRDFPNITYTEKDMSEQFWVEPKDDMFHQMLTVFDKK